MAEEMIIVQTVAKDYKSLAIRKGKEDGISVGQESYFATQKVGFIAKAIKVTRNFSIWKPTDYRALIPFEKDQVIIFNPAPEAIWAAIDKKLPKSSQKLRTFHKNSTQAHWLLSGSLFQGLTETIDGVEGSTSTSRAGLNLGLKRESDLSESLSYSYGARVDRELTETSQISATTNRLFATVDLSYHFPRFEFDTFHHMYIGGAFAYGYTMTSIGGESQKGPGMIIPWAFFGIQLGEANSKFWRLQVEFEQVISTQKIETIDSSIDQKIEQTNIKLSALYAF